MFVETKKIAPQSNLTSQGSVYATSPSPISTRSPIAASAFESNTILMGHSSNRNCRQLFLCRVSSAPMSSDDSVVAFD